MGSVVHSVAQAACLRCPTRISCITSNTRTPSSFGIGASQGEAFSVVCASENPCCHRASIVARLNWIHSAYDRRLKDFSIVFFWGRRAEAWLAHASIASPQWVLHQTLLLTSSDRVLAFRL